MASSGSSGGSDEHSDERVRKLTEQLALAQQELDGFAYTVSHDLRAPLRAMRHLSEVLLEDEGDKLGRESRLNLEALVDSANRMSELVDALLDFSRTTRGLPEPHAIDLADIARDVVDELRRAEPGRDVQVDVAQALPARADPEHARVVLSNLIENAWKFSGAKPQTRIQVGRESTPKGEAFFVRDEGVGFDPRQGHRLFGVFQRLHGNEFEGVGTGLATVERLVRRHGGQVWAAGESGRGATFYFTLPDATAE